MNGNFPYCMIVTGFVLFNLSTQKSFSKVVFVFCTLTDNRKPGDKKSLNNKLSIVP